MNFCETCRTTLGLDGNLWLNMIQKRPRMSRRY